MRLSLKQFVDYFDAVVAGVDVGPPPPDPLAVATATAKAAHTQSQRADSAAACSTAGSSTAAAASVPSDAPPQAVAALAPPDVNPARPAPPSGGTVVGSTATAATQATSAPSPGAQTETAPALSPPAVERAPEPAPSVMAAVPATSNDQQAVTTVGSASSVAAGASPHAPVPGAAKCHSEERPASADGATPSAPMQGAPVPSSVSGVQGDAPATTHGAPEVFAVAPQPLALVNTASSAHRAAGHCANPDVPTSSTGMPADIVQPSSDDGDNQS